MKKRILSLILALAMLCTLLPQAALTASAETLSGSCGAEGDNLTWSFDSETGLLTISGSGAMADYVIFENNAPWYDYREAITAISLPVGLTSIGNGAFEFCDAIASVSIPDSVTSIGDEAFAYCSSLTDMTIPDSVTSIGSYAFCWCSALTGVSIPNSVTSLGNLPFYGCFALTEINVASDNPNYFSDNGVLFQKTQAELIHYPAGKTETSYQMPAGVISIGQYAFDSCSALTSVTISNGVTDIGYCAFNNCTALTSVSIPNSVTSIGGSAFTGCSALTDMIIPDGVTSIGDSAFIGCSALTSVTIPDGVSVIENNTFSSCSALTSVTIGNGVTSIGGSSFSFCAALTSVNIPASVTGIGDSAFAVCRALTSVTIPDSVTSIGDFAFFDCPALTNVTVPASVTGIGEKALGYYLSLSFDTYIHSQHVKVDGFTIYGYNGTAAQDYAAENEFAFISLDNAVGEFVDVTPTDYFADPVLWAINHEPAITAGVGVHSFGPNNPCTREQIVTFLWAANGKPAPAGTGSTFSDVPADAWYYKPVMWAVENEITKGMEDGSFGVGQPCTRAQAMTFLWAAKGKPAPSSLESTFSDVSSGDWFCKAILWAAENGITKGVGNGLFGVNNTCTRAQIITFLYKAYK